MRIQILRLPEVVVGEVVETPFALIVDRYSGEVGPVDAAIETLSTFRDDCGARACLVAEDTVDVAVPVTESIAEPLLRIEGAPVLDEPLCPNCHKPFSDQPCNLTMHHNMHLLEDLHPGAAKGWDDRPPGDGEG